MQFFGILLEYLRDRIYLQGTLNSKWLVYWVNLTHYFVEENPLDATPEKPMVTPYKVSIETHLIPADRIFSFSPAPTFSVWLEIYPWTWDIHSPPIQSKNGPSGCIKPVYFASLSRTTFICLTGRSEEISFEKSRKKPKRNQLHTFKTRRGIKSKHSLYVFCVTGGFSA